MEALPEPQRLEWYHSAGMMYGADAYNVSFTPGSWTAGIVVITEDKLVFQTWHEGDAYHTIAMTPICDITDVIVTGRGRETQLVVVITNHPDSYSIGTPIGAPKPERAQEMAQLLRQQKAKCP